MVFRTLVKQYKFFRGEKYRWKKEVEKCYASMIGREHSVQPKQGCFQVVPTIVNGISENAVVSCPYFIKNNFCNQYDCCILGANRAYMNAVKKYEKAKNVQLCIARFIVKKVLRKMCGKNK